MFCAAVRVKKFLLFWEGTTGMVQHLEENAMIPNIRAVEGIYKAAVLQRQWEACGGGKFFFFFFFFY